MKIYKILPFVFLSIFSKITAQNTFPTTGNVGIGTITPQYKLDVNGTTNNVALRVNAGGVNIGDGSGFLGFHFSNMLPNQQYFTGFAHNNSAGNFDIKSAGRLSLYFSNNTLYPFRIYSQSWNTGTSSYDLTERLKIDGSNGSTTITGDLNLTTSATQVIGGFGAGVTSGAPDWNDISNARSGNGYTLLLGSATNGSGLEPSTYYHPFSFEYNAKNGSGNMTQFAIPYTVGTNSGKLHFRSRYGGVWSAWQRIPTQAQTDADYGKLIGTNNWTGSNTFSRVILNGTGADYKELQFKTGNSLRWSFFSTEAETGSNAGSNLTLNSYNDSGSFLNTILNVRRSSGNVGIGTASPSQKLHVAGSIQLDNYVFGYQGRGIMGSDVGGSYFGSLGGSTSTLATYIAAENAPIRFHNNGVERMRITETGNVGIGTTSPTSRLDVNGLITSDGMPVNLSYPNSNVYFDMQQALEGNKIPSYVLNLRNQNYTIQTDNNTTSPFSKVVKFASACEGEGAYIPVQAGERIYGEVWVKRDNGASGTAGIFYAGCMQLDKDKKYIADNAGLNYFIATAVTTPTNGVWVKYSGYLTIPSSHTPYNGSDGGAVRYIRPYLIVNYTGGTIPTYVSGFRIRKVDAVRDNGQVNFNGNVSIGVPFISQVSADSYKLAIGGNALAEKMVVKLQTNWPDYVFHSDYALPPLSQVEEHIKTKGHLPNIPTEKEVKETGIDLGDMNAKLLQKIEELTLYLIEIKKQNEKDVQLLKEEIKKLKSK